MSDYQKNNLGLEILTSIFEIKLIIHFYLNKSQTI